MTDKQIIIEDCPYFVNGVCMEYLDGACENHKCDLKIIRELEQQLKRKEQECERLKETFDGLFKVQYKLADNNKKLRQCLTEIKDMLKEICMEECLFDWNKTSKKHCGDCDCRFMQLLEKISECEGNDE